MKMLTFVRYFWYNSELWTLICVHGLDNEKLYKACKDVPREMCFIFTELLSLHAVPYSLRMNYTVTIPIFMHFKILNRLQELNILILQVQCTVHLKKKKKKNTHTHPHARTRTLSLSFTQIIYIQ
jgi:hypothetical protein